MINEVEHLFMCLLAFSGCLGFFKHFECIRPLPLVSKVSDEKSAVNLIENPFYMMTSKIPDIWRARSSLPTLASKRCMQAAPGTPVQLPAMWLAGGWGVGGR